MKNEAVELFEFPIQINLLSQCALDGTRKLAYATALPGPVSVASRKSSQFAVINMSTNVLLDPLPPDLESTYLHELLSLMGLSEKVEVRRDAIRGRCLHAKASYKRGDLIWKEPPLVAMQHLSSAEQAPCCSHCFAYLGSCEYQIGSRLMYQIRHHKSLAERGEVDDEEVKAAREQVERVSESRALRWIQRK